MFFILLSLIISIPNIHSSPVNDEWWKKTQIYSMTAYDFADSKNNGITVNGLWNGYIGKISSPFALGRLLLGYYYGKTYSSDKEFVDELHSQGLIVPATILTTQGHRSLQEDYFEKVTCRTYNNKIPDWNFNAKSSFMCSNKEELYSWMIKHGKKAIEAGADLIVLDEIQGNGFIPLMQWYHQYLQNKEPGFCEDCIGKFRNYLKNRFSASELKSNFNISNIDNYDLKTRIYKTINLDYYTRIAKDSLIKYYIDFQERNNYLLKKRLIDDLRIYSGSKRRKLPITANSYALGTSRVGDYWIKGLIFSDDLDFFTFENHNSAFPFKNNIEFPRDKWIPWERLALSATGSTFVIMPDTEAIDEMNNDFKNGKQSYTNYLYIKFLEAYMNGGAFANYYAKFEDNFKLWEKCGKGAKFILDNKKIYDSGAESLSEIGILFIYNENTKDRVFTYLGISLALSESNIQYDTLFGGGRGYYLRDRLNSKSLKKYKLIFIPNGLNITKNQKTIIQNFVREGGKAIVFDRETFTNKKSNSIKYGNGYFIILSGGDLKEKKYDIGQRYFFNYNDNDRKLIRDMVVKYLTDSQMIKEAKRKIVSRAYYNRDKKMIIIHLLNYNHEYKTDNIIPLSNIEIKIKKPDYLFRKTTYMVSPDFTGKIFLKPMITDKFIIIKLSNVSVYNLIVIGAKSSQFRR